ncbi:MAG TPA: NAD(P)-dependent oxidoreductase [Gemmatimonadaceae bacterium]|jgi:3-hydroxyisobutyrate dehydrogenase|nr:NAD(P)-dependent oxidoreductase [Gemmatimonadaceae bacterium]
MTRIAFLGLGDIGAPMAGHLAAAFELTVWNRTPARATAFVSAHRAQAAPTAAEAVRGAAVVASCLSTSSDVEAVVGAAASGLAADTIWVDFTSGDPATSQRIAARLAELGVPFLDAPVSGGTAGAQQGTLTIMLGGDPIVIERVRPVLNAVGKKIVHCGPIGAGDAVKAVNNALLAVNLWSAGEGLAALKKAGVSSAVALDVINASSGRSNATMTLIPERVASRAFPRTFRLALLDKDVGIAAQVARDQKVPSPLLQLTAELMRLAHVTLGEVADHAEAVKVIETWAGVEIS